VITVVKMENYKETQEWKENEKIEKEYLRYYAIGWMKKKEKSLGRNSHPTYHRSLQLFTSI
jgi:hypothetical protein